MENKDLNTTDFENINQNDNTKVYYANTENKQQDTNETIQNTINNCSQSKKCKIGKYIFYGAIVIAIGVLFFLQIRTARNSQLTVTEIDVPKGPNDIAYINMDTINEHCELFKLLKADLEKETAQKEAVLGNKQKAWQTKVQNYQQNMQNGSLTQLQMQNAEKSLQQEQQQLMELSEQYRTDLEAKQSAIMLQVYDSIQTCVKRINNHSFKAKFILSYQYGSGVLYADKNFDMTNAVLEDLNKNFKK